MKSTSVRLASVLLGYVVLIVLLLTLSPFYVSLPDHFRFVYESSKVNLIQNILLFLPLGFLYRLTTRRRDVLLMAAALSLCIELLQLFLPDRTTSFIDILANTSGAGLGSLLYELSSKQLVLSSGTVYRLRLETPLMGLIYLLVPLLWADSINLKNAPDRGILLAPIGLCGASIFGDVFRHWRAKVDSRAVASSALGAGLWFLIGAGPGIAYSRTILVIGICLMLVAGLLTFIPRSNKDRRFEQSSLKRLLPFLLLYLFLLAIWSPFVSFGAWHASFGYTAHLTNTRMQTFYPRLEYEIAFTVLGYLIAEWRGRLEQSLRRGLPRVFLVAAMAALILEILSGFQIGRGASFMRFVFAIAGALFGGMIYHTSRAHIRYLLGR